MGAFFDHSQSHLCYTHDMECLLYLFGTVLTFAFWVLSVYLYQPVCAFLNGVGKNDFFVVAPSFIYLQVGFVYLNFFLIRLIFYYGPTIVNGVKGKNSNEDELENQVEIQDRTTNQNRLSVKELINYILGNWFNKICVPIVVVAMIFALSNSFTIKEDKIIYKKYFKTYNYTLGDINAIKIKFEKGKNQSLSVNIYFDGKKVDIFQGGGIMSHPSNKIILILDKFLDINPDLPFTINYDLTTQNRFGSNGKKAFSEFYQYAISHGASKVE